MIYNWSSPDKQRFQSKEYGSCHRFRKPHGSASCPPENSADWDALFEYFIYILSHKNTYLKTRPLQCQRRYLEQLLAQMIGTLLDIISMSIHVNLAPSTSFYSCPITHSLSFFLLSLMPWIAYRSSPLSNRTIISGGLKHRLKVIYSWWRALIYWWMEYFCYY